METKQEQKWKQNGKAERERALLWRCCCLGMKLPRGIGKCHGEPMVARSHEQKYHPFRIRRVNSDFQTNQSLKQ